MTTNEKLEGAFSQARAQLESIKEMVATLEAAAEGHSFDAVEEAERAIHEDALSVEVRADWHAPNLHASERNKPSHYRILLCTGGPAVQIVGRLSEHCEPESAELQAQDWFTPWTRVPTSRDDDAVLLSYASRFWFGE